MSNLPGTWGLWGGYLPFIVAGFLASEPWRWAGAILGRNLDVESEGFLWVRAVSTAIIAGLVARMLVFPSGALVAVPLTVRLAAIFASVIVYFLARRNLGIGVLGGIVVLVTGEWLTR